MSVLDAVKDHTDALRVLVSWDRVGVLIDEGWNVLTETHIYYTKYRR